MNLAYVRVSTAEQNEDRQVKALEAYGIDKWFVEKVSAKDTNRPELQIMLEFCREGDCIYIHDFSRLARNTKDLLGIVERIEGKGVRLVSYKEQYDTSTAVGRLVLTVIAAIAEFERDNLLERQREGIALAREQGKYNGRKPVSISDFPSWYDKYENHELNKFQLAQQLNISRPTLNKLIHEEEKRRSELKE